VAKRVSTRPCLGGPHDGREACAARDAIAYLDENGRAWQKSAPGRALYEQDGGSWSFLGLGAYRCKCGAYVKQRPDGMPTLPCPLCGHVGRKGSHA